MAINISGSFMDDSVPMSGNVDGVPHFGIQGPPGPQGASGGYYVPAIEQTGENELEVSFSPSLPDMPAVDPVQVELPHSGGNAENGEDGFSPVATVEQTATGAVISITDKTGTTTVTITNGKDGMDGADGQDGYTPQKGIDYFDGQPGKDGADGKDGYTPVKGVDYFDGNPGKDGVDGKNGTDGYTPVKGKDYFDGNPGVDGEDGVTPHIGSNGNWFIGNTDTGKPSRGADGQPGQDGSNGQPGADGVSPTVTVSKSGKVTMVSITDKNGTKTATIKDGADGADAPDPDAIPSYWQTALDNGVEAINTAIESAGRNKSAFLYYTDAHWGYGSGMSPKLLKYLGKHTAMNKTVFGGDFGNTYDGTDETRTMEYWMDVMRSWKLAIRDIANHHSVVGNHDKDVTAISTDKALYGFLMAPEETNDIVRGGDFFYYVDDQNEKTRYIYLNTGLGVFDDAQCGFVIDALKSLDTGWHVVAVAHIWFVYDSTNTPTKGSIPANTQKLLALFDAYNSRGSGAVTLNTSHAYDFSNCGGWVEFCIGGHTHVDYTFTSEKGIPVILCCTDSKHLRGSDYTYTAGTTTESSVSGIIADYDAKKIKIIRIGRGSSHEVEMTWFEVSYTNVLPTALAQDGSIYNASDTPGYKKDTRWSSSSNVDQTQAGTYITGYIKFTPGDTIYLKNIVMPNATGNTCLIHLFKTLDDTSEGNVNHDNIVSHYSPIWGEDGNLVQFTIPTTSTYSYVRIQCGGIDSTSIITINEPID